MSVETMYTLRQAPVRSLLFPELSVVEVVADVRTDDGQHVPAGSRGTVVLVYGGGKAYEVEFARPVVGNTTLRPDVLRAVQVRGPGPTGGSPDAAVGLTIPGRKIAQYLLNLDHPDGGPKAAFFLARGADPANVEPFLVCLFDHARFNPVASEEATEFGVKRVHEGPMTLPDGSTHRARSVWFRPTGDDRCLLVTAYPF